MNNKKEFILGYDQEKMQFFFIKEEYVRNVLNGTIINEETNEKIDINVDSLIYDEEGILNSIENSNNICLMYYIVLGKDVDYPKESIGDIINNEIIQPLYIKFKNDNKNSKLIESENGNIVYLNYAKKTRFIV